LKKFLLILFIFLVVSFKVSSQTGAKLSPEAEISLITCGPGSDLYSVFGHSAIRVNDPKIGIDAVFNYGTFQFTDDFYFKFVMGKLNYMMSVSIFTGFYKSYVYENRQLLEQVLDLNKAQKQKLFDLLIDNNRPENRFYLYDFFYNNCSTKIRDKLVEAVNTDVVFNSTPPENDVHFRTMLDLYLVQMDWSDFGIDLALGLPCDVTPNNWDDMFLPDELMVAFDQATINDNGTVKPLVKETQILFQSIPMEHRFPYYMQPANLTWFFFLVMLVISFLEVKNRKNYILFDKIYFGIIGFFGLFLTFLWLGTDHNATAQNLNILWASPLLFFAGFFNLNENQKPWIKYFFLAFGVFISLLIAFWNFLPQDLHFAAMPLAGLIGLRSLLIYYKAKRLYNA